jgi:cyclophilin family peptidyl-prolyl cis-trans isomerase
MRRLVYLTTLVSLMAASPGVAQESNPVVIMDTNYGTITIELFARRAPVTVKNFLSYVDAKHYDGTIFHRVINNFMIQGGGFTEDMKEKATKPPIKNEASTLLENKRGTIATARTAMPDSATSQFYINVVDNPSLDKANAKDGAGYCVFGKVIDGMDVVDKIAQAQTGAKNAQMGDKAVPFQDVPIQPVVIKAVRLSRL